MPRFDTYQARAHAVTDRLYAEGVRLLFMKNGAQDPDRAPVEIKARLRLDEVDTAASDDARGDITPRVAGQAGTLAIDRFTHPDIVSAEGDIVVALERPGEPVFSVLKVNDRSHRRHILHLGMA